MGKRGKKHGKRNSILVALLLVFFAAGIGGQSGKNDQQEPVGSQQSVFFEVSEGETQEASAEISTVMPTESAVEAEQAASDEEESLTASETAVQEPALQTLSVEEIPAYTGEPAIEINGNVPNFTDKEYTTEAFEKYSPLDELGRCGTAYACVGEEIMPTEERGAIGMVKPSGWHTVKYDFVDGKYLFNRCHLIAYQLSGENSNTENLITGTRYLNVEGMLPYENQVADYVHDTGNHVLYRVTPLFDGDNLVASGVEIEAASVEDQGKSLSFHVYCYNVQPGVEIDYATGESKLSDDSALNGDNTAEKNSNSSGSDDSSKTQAADLQKEEDSSVNSTAKIAAVVAMNSSEEDDSSENAEVQDYVLNKNTKKFHYPWCSSADDIKKKNRKDFTGTRDEVIAQGYVPCKRCNP